MLAAIFSSFASTLFPIILIGAKLLCYGSEAILALILVVAVVWLTLMLVYGFVVSVIENFREDPVMTLLSLLAIGFLGSSIFLVCYGIDPFAIVVI